MPRLLPISTRRLSLAAAITCLTLFIALVWLWATTQTAYRQLEIDDSQLYYGLSIYQGGIYLSRMEMLDVIDNPNSSSLQLTPAPYHDHWKLGSRTGEPNRPPLTWNVRTSHWGLFYVSSDSINMGRLFAGQAFGIPAYAIALPLLLATLFFLYTFTKRHPKSHCQSCGYNLSGNPSAKSCPECGRATPITP